MFPNAPIYLLGHSLGGQLGALFLAANSTSLNGLILVAAPSVYYKYWRFPLNLAVLIGIQTARLVSSLLGYFPGKRLGFGGTEAKGVIHDLAHQSLTGRYEPLNANLNYEQLLGKLSTTVLAISFLGDFFAPPRAVKKLCDKMPLAKIKFVSISDMKFNHTDWVKNNGIVMNEIRSWILRDKS